MTSDFKEQFQSRNSENKLETFTRQECLKHFEVEEDEDDVVVIQNILKSPKLNPDSVIFFDETSIERPNKSYDWLMLQNPRPEVTAIVSFQPLQEANKFNTRPVKLSLPPEAAHIELTKCYRASSSIFDCLKSVQYLNIKMIDTKADSVNAVSGPKPVIMKYSTVEDNLKLWIIFKLLKLLCDPKDITIIFTDNTKEDAEKIFHSTVFASCLKHWKSVIGCESLVIVCFCSNEDSWQMFTMVSRAQYHLFILNRNSPLFDEVENVVHLTIKDAEDLINKNSDFFKEFKSKVDSNFERKDESNDTDTETVENTETEQVKQEKTMNEAYYAIALAINEGFKNSKDFEFDEETVVQRLTESVKNGDPGYETLLKSFGSCSVHVRDKEDIEKKLTIKIKHIEDVTTFDFTTFDSIDHNPCLIVFQEHFHATTEERCLFVESVSHTKKGWIAHCLSKLLDYRVWDIRLADPDNRFFQLSCSLEDRMVDAKTDPPSSSSSSGAVAPSSSVSSVESSQFITISTPDASQYGDYSARCLGSYEVCGEYDGTVCYKQLNTVTDEYPTYLYRHNKKRWYASKKLGDTGYAWLMSDTGGDTPPARGWKYFCLGSWCDDTSLVLQYGLPTPCSRVTLTVSDASLRDIAGDYTATQDYDHGRTVFIHESGTRYLRYYGNYGCWSVMETLSGDEMIARSYNGRKTVCPFQDRAKSWYDCRRQKSVYTISLSYFT